jgi:hypothetical protein
MVLEPLRVPAAGAAAGEMVLDPLAVPTQGAAAGSAAPATGQPGQPATSMATALVSPPTTQAFRFGALRVVIFAAGTDAKAPAYDGIVIEPVPVAAPKGKGARSRAQGSATPARTGAGESPKPAAAPPAKAAPPANAAH